MDTAYNDCPLAFIHPDDDHASPAADIPCDAQDAPGDYADPRFALSEGRGHPG